MQEPSPGPRHADDPGSGAAPDVIIDGRRLSWAQFGRATFDGWRFRPGLGDDDVPTPAPRLGA